MTMLDVSVFRPQDDVAVLCLVGELDISSGARLQRELSRLEGEDPPAATTVLDLRSLAFLDSSGLRLIVGANERARQQRRRLVIIPGPEQVHRVFRITLVDRRLEFVDGTEQLLGI